MIPLKIVAKILDVFGLHIGFKVPRRYYETGILFVRVEMHVQFEGNYCTYTQETGPSHNKQIIKVCGP